jgi:hypothetical protein
MGLNNEEFVIPSVKTLGYCQYVPEHHEMASSVDAGADPFWVEGISALDH